MSNRKDDLYAQLEALPERIKRFYGAYFAELRRGLERPDVFSAAVPGFLEGHKRVLAVGGTDGVTVAHFPVELEITVSGKDSGAVLLRFSSEPEAGRDVYEFVAPFDLSARRLAELLSEEEDIGLEIPEGEPWGVQGFASPQQKVDTTTGQLAWQAPWTRLICADFHSLDYWSDERRAQTEAREDLDPYRRPSEPRAATVYDELDEVEAPARVEEAGVEAGDRGVVVEVFEHPRLALLVEYADPSGRPKALVTYSPDLGRVLDILKTPSSGRTRTPAAKRNPEPRLVAHVYAPPAA